MTASGGPPEKAAGMSSADPDLVALLAEAFMALAGDQIEQAVKAGYRVREQLLVRGSHDGGLEGAALGVSGAAAARQGDFKGLELVQRGVELLAADGRYRTAGRCCAIWAHTAWRAGRLRTMAVALDRGRHLTHVAGDHDRDQDAVLKALAAAHDYHTGRWDRAIQTASAALEEAPAGSHAVRWCGLLRAAIRLARGDLDGAQGDAIAAQQAAAPDFYPVDHQLIRVLLGRLDLAFGNQRRAAGAAAVLPRLHERYWWAPATLPPDYGVLLADLRAAGVEVTAVDSDYVSDHVTPTDWLPAVQAMIVGEYEQAVHEYARLGARPEEAEARRLAAWALRDRRDPARARELLAPAIRFWRSRSVAATAALDEVQRQFRPSVTRPDKEPP